MSDDWRTLQADHQKRLRERRKADLEQDRIRRLSGRRRVLVNLEHVCPDCGGKLKITATREQLGMKVRYCDCPACQAELFVVVKES